MIEINENNPECIYFNKKTKKCTAKKCKFNWKLENKDCKNNGIIKYFNSPKRNVLLF